MSEKNKIKVSVVMPIFNMENYVETAIESWLKQSLHQKELICIDDCSTDTSLSILKEYERRYSNVHVFSMESNQGAGRIRKKAMEFVEGQYVSFLDADDKYLNTNALEILYNTAIEGECDISGGLLKIFNENKIIEYPRFRDMFLGEDYLYRDLKYQDFLDDYLFQGFLFNVDFLKRNKIEFPPLRRYQDPPFLVKSLFYANRIRVVNIEVYGYRYEYKNVKYTSESVMDLLNGLLLNMEFADVHNLDGLFKKTIDRLNIDYLEILQQGLRFHNYNFIERLLYAHRLAEKRGYKIEILEYLFYLERKSSRIAEYKIVQKLRGNFSEKNRIILYGAGDVGQSIFSSITIDHICNVVLWVDHFKAGKFQNGRILYDINDINTISEDYDYILIGINKMEISKQVKSDLILYGVTEEKIIEWVNL